MRCFIPLLMMATPAMADPLRVHSAAQAMFADLPGWQQVEDIHDVCGAGHNTNPRIGYCTSDNTIYVTADFFDRRASSYEIAHVLGHAIQVRHGVADVALREIRSRRSEEAALRGMVTRQVECVAGVIMARTGLGFASIPDLYDEEPFTDSHWGRNPLNDGPRVSIGIEARAEWFEIGYRARDFTACTVGDMSSDLIVEALR